MPLSLYAQENLPVAQRTVAVWILKHLALQSESLSFFVVDVSFDAGLATCDEDRMPEHKGTEGQGNRTAKDPGIHYALVESSLAEGEGRRWCLRVSLNSSVSFPEHIPATDTAVDATHGHEQHEGEEVAMVVMSHAVV